MPTATPGLHHVTAIASDPQRNYEFYTETLGLRLVKRSVNQDDVSVYHLFYADHEGTPGTSMTFFPYTDARDGQVGAGQVSAVSFLVPDGSIDYWRERLADAGADPDEPRERFGDTVLSFTDPDGLPLELVARADAPAANLPESPVPHAHAIRGFFGVTLSLTGADPTGDLLKEMGYRQTDRDGTRKRYTADGDLGFVVDIVEDPQARRGIPGAGTVHHIAFQVAEDEQDEWRQFLIDHGLRPTEIIDRKWFKSVYAREYGTVLFEYATKEPGYTVDEELEDLGDRLVLPEWLEDRREEIETGLPDLSH
ncbi:Glyoxalase/bleomycin resistance protein/dioxygenase [Haloterrigena turkmenica DSM 5511]|uniref:Glyoxalase/bleomycin resistance protein/dioxygenase n=1 Tax=Haloterrigena turkmenica (strain ATCC 51198 / DSM 5511 / JCM 9101 / NCIMB 13204 / VKM B-1734 / 4k) TaxID=543526 RepID=D2RT31_HALTV|nr:VOC family protein [Haloterrigena turkmenica]ADB60911.1 Glyoxalase/bleomycin resistance protein/dioxygenase [Haloterrigena turkmenica DSM 5511]